MSTNIIYIFFIFYLFFSKIFDIDHYLNIPQALQRSRLYTRKRSKIYTSLPLLLKASPVDEIWQSTRFGMKTSKYRNGNQDCLVRIIYVSSTSEFVVPYSIVSIDIIRKKRPIDELLLWALQTDCYNWLLKFTVDRMTSRCGFDAINPLFRFDRFNTNGGGSCGRQADGC